MLNSCSGVSGVRRSCNGFNDVSDVFSDVSNFSDNIRYRYTVWIYCTS